MQGTTSIRRCRRCMRRHACPTASPKRCASSPRRPPTLPAERPALPDQRRLHRAAVGLVPVLQRRLRGLRLLPTAARSTPTCDAGAVPLRRRHPLARSRSASRPSAPKGHRRCGDQLCQFSQSMGYAPRRRGRQQRLHHAQRPGRHRPAVRRLAVRLQHRQRRPRCSLGRLRPPVHGRRASRHRARRGARRLARGRLGAHGAVAAARARWRLTGRRSPWPSTPRWPRSRATSCMLPSARRRSWCWRHPAGARRRDRARASCASRWPAATAARRRPGPARPGARARRARTSSRWSPPSSARPASARPCSALEAREAAERAEDPGLRRILGRIADDEQRPRRARLALASAGPASSWATTPAPAPTRCSPPPSPTPPSPPATWPERRAPPELRAHGVVDAPLRASVWLRGLEGLVQLGRRRPPRGRLSESDKRVRTCPPAPMSSSVTHRCDTPGDMSDATYPARRVILNPAAHLRQHRGHLHVVGVELRPPR